MNKEVLLIVKPDCSGCDRVKNYLSEKGIVFEVIDATKDVSILLKYPITMAPGIVVDKNLKFVGTPSDKEMNELFSS